MKITKEEQLKAIKNTVKELKGDISRTTKAVIIASYMHDVTWLMRELAKAGTGLRLGEQWTKVGLAKAQKPSV